MISPESTDSDALLAAPSGEPTDSDLRGRQSSDGPDDIPFTFIEHDDDLGPGRRWSTWDEIGISAGPEPWPEWLITDSAAIDTDLAILKTGKEADVVLLERATSQRSVVMAAKRYRSRDHRLFHRDAGYTEGRRLRNSRDRRAQAKGTAWGRTVQASQWARAEFGYLARFHELGLPVPYPVQLDDVEVLLELITDRDGVPAPRLAQTRPDRATLDSYWEQLRESICLLASRRLAHGDLSPFNILATGERIVLIDVPQVVDVVANPQGMDYLARDCRNVATWFAARGLPVDGEELFADAAAYAW